MKLKSIFILLLLCNTLVISHLAFGQKIENKTLENDSTTIYEVILKNGSVFYGKIISQNEAEITFSTDEIEAFTLQKSKIKSMNINEGLNQRRGEYWFENPNSSRYFVGPSAFGLKKGEGYYQNIYILINTVNYGLSDYFSIGGGFETVSLFTGTPAFTLNSKINIPISKKFKAAAGVLVLALSEQRSEIQGIGIGYGILSYGSKDHNISGGIGFGWNSEDFSKTPIYTISGMTRLSRKISLVSENWIFPNFDTGTIYSYGVRFMGQKLSVDLGFWNNSEVAQYIPIGIPYVDFTVKF